MANNKGNMTVQEAGHKGGQKTASSHDRGFYQEIGHKGGVKGGRKGGEATKQRHGPEFYQQIGHKGGQRVKELIEEGEKSEGK